MLLPTFVPLCRVSPPPFLPLPWGDLPIFTWHCYHLGVSVSTAAIGNFGGRSAHV